MMHIHRRMAQGRIPDKAAAAHQAGVRPIICGLTRPTDADTS